MRSPALNKQKFTVLAVNNTIVTTDVHLYIAISNKQSKTIGGRIDNKYTIPGYGEIIKKITYFKQ